MKKLIIGLAGEPASGKSSATTYLMEHHHAGAHRFSTPLRDVVRRLHLTEDRKTIQKISTFLRKEFGEDLFSRVIAKDVVADTHNIIVVDGVRRPDDVKYLRDLPGFHLVYISTSLETRFSRLSTRGQNVDDLGKTFAEFKRDHEHESETQIRYLEPLADLVIDNNGTAKILQTELDNILVEHRMKSMR